MAEIALYYQGERVDDVERQTIEPGQDEVRIEPTTVSDVVVDEFRVLVAGEPIYSQQFEEKTLWGMRALEIDGLAEDLPDWTAMEHVHCPECGWFMEKEDWLFWCYCGEILRVSQP